MTQVPLERETLRSGDLVLDESRWTVHRAGEPVELSPTEFRLLAYLMRHQGSVLSRAQLLRDVWGGDYAGQAQIVETYVSYLRRKLDRFGPPLIHTRRGAGYTLRCPERVLPLISRSSDPLDNGRVGLAAAFAHGLQAEPATGRSASAQDRPRSPSGCVSGPAVSARTG
jgi:DNA-binding winged helix-turn-helix (wHTH) protein